MRVEGVYVCVRVCMYVWLFSSAKADIRHHDKLIMIFLINPRRRFYLFIYYDIAYFRTMDNSI